MRQALSIYARSARLAGQRIAKKIVRKLQKVAGQQKPEAQSRSPRPVIELSLIESALSTLGITRGDRLMIHSGISHLGKIKGGAPTLMTLLREKVGEEGILLFPAFPFGTLMYDYVNSQPEFDVRTSPSKMGALTEIALADPQRIRSLHPTHSVSGFGQSIAYFLENHHLDPTPFGPHSPFWRLAEADGKILVIGVGLASVTGFHLTEDWLGEKFPVRVYLDQVYRVQCRNAQGQSVEVLTRCHDPSISQIRDCYIVEDLFIREGFYQKIPVGQHFIGVIDARRMNECLQRLAIKEHLTIYGRIWG